MTESRWWGRLGVTLTYLLLSCLLHLEALAGLTSRTPCRCEDAPQTDWFLAWTPYALSQGRTPLFTDHLIAPEGVNLMWNTLLPLPGVLMAPVTAWLGPVASHNLLAILAFAGSALTMHWAVGRWVTWGPARFVAGLLYGFSPYLVAQGRGHLNLSLVLLPPVVLVLLHELLVRQRRRAVVTGALLGLVTTAQLLITEEVLASLLVVCIVGVVVLLVQHRARRAQVRHTVAGLAVAAGSLTLLAAYPLWVQFFGDRVVTGEVQDTSPTAADLLGLVVPTENQLLGTDLSTGWGGNLSENGSYLGAPLLVLLVVASVRLRHVAVVRYFSVLALAVWVLSLGERLRVGGTDTGVPLPFAAVSALPVLRNLIAVRLSLYVALCAAVVLAVVLERARPALVARPAARAGALLVGLVTLLTLLPARPYPHEPTATPAYFTTDAVLAVPEGSTALLYPIPRFPSTAPMLWQAEADFRFKVVGGYVITPLEDGTGTFQGGRTRVEDAFTAAAVGQRLPASVSADLRQLVAGQLDEAGVTSVLVSLEERGAAEVLRWLSLLLERDPDEVVGGVAAWYAVDWSVLASR